MLYPWPGNVRELGHAIEHAFVLCHGQNIAIEHLPPEIIENSGIEKFAPVKGSVYDQQEILEALNKTDWNKAKAARILGISRRTIYRKIDEYKLAKTS